MPTGNSGRRVEDQVQARVFLDQREHSGLSAACLQRQASASWAGRALLILGLGLHVLYGVRGLCLQGQGPYKDSHLHLLTKGSKCKSSKPIRAPSCKSLSLHWTKPPWASSVQFLNDFGPVSRGRAEDLNDRHILPARLSGRLKMTLYLLPVKLEYILCAPPHPAGRKRKRLVVWETCDPGVSRSLVRFTGSKAEFCRSGPGMPSSAPAEASRRKTADLTHWAAALVLCGEPEPRANAGGWV